MERGIPAAELAEVVGITRQHMHALERGKHTPSLPLLLKLADALAVRFTLTQATKAKGEVHIEPETAYWNSACFVAVEEE